MPDGAGLATPFLAELRNLVRARAPIIHVNTHEEDRCLKAIRQLGRELDLHVLAWSASRGAFPLEPPREGQSLGQRLADFAGAIEFFEKQVTGRDRHPGGYLFVLLDPYPYLGDPNANPVYRRRLRDFAINIRTRAYRASSILLSPGARLPLELEKEVTIVDFPPPGRAEIADYLTTFAERLAAQRAFKVDHDPALIEKLVDASLGLTLMEIEGALATALVEDFTFSFGDVEKIFRQKQQIIRKSGVLEYIDTRSLSLGEVGGLDIFKEWLRIRAGALSPRARAFGIEAPKGVLVTGIPGCGKSWSAKCVAASWRLPLVRLDMGRVYSALVGSSEEHMRDAIGTTEAIAPCVLWIDEIEKGLPHPRGFVGDSGVSLRVLGNFLTWLQEKTAPVFVFATANQIDQLPPEILRKGRFDEVFFVDLPSDAERRDILNIHLRRARRDPARLDLAELVRLSGPAFLGDGASLTGAEVAAWVNEALIHAFDRGEAELTIADFRKVAKATVPLAQMRREEIRDMREWAARHAVGASARATI
jgi:ATP-dependent 26S proteasome regulatory subunit